MILGSAATGIHERLVLSKTIENSSYGVVRVDNVLALNRLESDSLVRVPMRPSAFPTTYEEHLKMMSELLVLALITDSTRIATLIFSRELSNRTFPSLGSFDGHHDLSHHSGKEHKIATLEKIDRFHVGQLALIVERLKATREGDRTLLDSLMLVFGSGLSDGNRHLHTNLPTLLIGRGDGSISPGRHIAMPKGTPVSNLWLSLLTRMRLDLPSFGDSSGTIGEMS